MKISEKPMSEYERHNPFVDVQTLPSSSFQFPLLTPWEWDLKDKLPDGGRLKFATLKSRPKVFMPLLSAMWVHCVACVPCKAFSYIRQYKFALTRFAEYLDKHEQPAVRNMGSLAELTHETLLDYRKYINERYTSSGAANLYRFLALLLLLLQGTKSPMPGSVPADLEIPLRALRAKEEDVETTQPYRNEDEAAIIAACKKEINQVLERLEQGKKMLAEGKDPRLDGVLRRGKTVYTTGWENNANLLWYIVHVLQPKQPLEPGQKDMLVRYIAENSRRTHKTFENRTQLYQWLYPHAPDLVPFIILLSLKTGLNADSIMDLKRDCIIGTRGDKTVIQYTKGRGSHELMTQAFSHKGAASPVGIIKTVLEMTSCMVPMASLEAKNFLWLACQHVTSVKGQKVSPLSQQYFYHLTNGTADVGSPFMERHGIRDEHGNVLAFGFKEGRTTHHTAAYVKSGNLAWISQKKLRHHGRRGVNTTAFHYLSNNATEPLHNRAIRHAQDRTVQEARRVVITDEKLEKDDLATLARQLSESEDKLLSVLSGEQDVFIAQCLDFYNKPGGAPNTPCADPWQCFTCKNALWTSRILPRLIKFSWFMEEQQKLLTPQDWHNKFALPYTVIQKDILPRFQTRTIEWAKAQAKDTPFYVPPHLKEI